MIGRGARGVVARFLAVGAAVLVLAGCQAAAADPTPTPSPTYDVGHPQGLGYSASDGSWFAIDACIPEAAGDAVPAVVLVHGGSFTGGSRTDLAPVCDALAAAGMAAFSVDYRLVPWGVFPSQAQDVASAIDWVRAPEQADAFGLDPDRVALLGASAGAVITAQLATGVTGIGFDNSVLAGAVMLSGGYDFTAPSDGLGLDLISALEGYLGCDIASCAALGTASPVTAASADDPPMLLIHSDSEFIPLDQAERFADRLTEVGVDNELLVVPGEAHAEWIYQVDPAAVTATADFLRTVLAG